MNGHIEIRHKYKDKDNKFKFKTVYRGPCVYTEVQSLRENINGAEAGGDVSVRVHTDKILPLCTGDLCILNGTRTLNIRRLSRCTEGKLPGFSHVLLKLR